MADHESVSTRRVRSPAQVAGLEMRPDFGCRLLTVDHGRASAPAGAVHTVDILAPSLVAGRLDRFLAGHPDATTPFLVVDLDVVRRQYVSLAAALPGTEVFYAVKANPAQRPYLGPVEGHFTTWTPLTGRSPLFPQDIDSDDPWQFRNVLVH